MAEKEYIEREVAIEAAIDAADEWDGGYNPHRSAQIRDGVNAIPAADVRRVVLCRDCKHAHMTHDGLCKYCDMMAERGVDDALYLPGDWFCADGERIEES